MVVVRLWLSGCNGGGGCITIWDGGGSRDMCERHGKHLAVLDGSQDTARIGGMCRHLLWSCHKCLSSLACIEHEQGGGHQ